MGGLWAVVLLPGLAGAAPRGQQPRWRCGEAVRYVARPRQAELRSGARPGRLRRCSALSLWAAWAADLQAFLLAPLALTVAAGVQAVCASAAPRWVTGIDRVDSVAPLLSVLGGLRGRCPRARLAPVAAGVELGRPAQVVCLAPECTGTPCFVAPIRTQCPITGRWSTEVACCSPSRHSCSPLQCCHPHTVL